VLSPGTVTICQVWKAVSLHSLQMILLASSGSQPLSDRGPVNSLSYKTRARYRAAARRLRNADLDTGLYLPSILQPDSLSLLRATCSDHFIVLRTRNVTVIRVAFRRFRIQAGARTPATLTWNFRDILRSLQANADISAK
jgi:hypothetical protein